MAKKKEAIPNAQQILDEVAVALDYEGEIGEDLNGPELAAHARAMLKARDKENGRLSHLAEAIGYDDLGDDDASHKALVEHARKISSHAEEWENARGRLLEDTLGDKDDDKLNATDVVNRIDDRIAAGDPAQLAKLLELVGLSDNEWECATLTRWEARFNPVEFLVERLRELAPEKLADGRGKPARYAAGTEGVSVAAPAAPRWRLPPLRPAPGPTCNRCGGSVDEGGGYGLCGSCWRPASAKDGA
jgi:hypothetical protein